ncbi:hypothetical protein CSC81_18035, partial [Tenacibaculum discolor]
SGPGLWHKRPAEAASPHRAGAGGGAASRSRPGSLAQRPRPTGPPRPGLSVFPGAGGCGLARTRCGTRTRDPPSW